MYSSMSCNPVTAKHNISKLLQDRLPQREYFVDGVFAGNRKPTVWSTIADDQVCLFALEVTHDFFCGADLK